MKTLIEQIKSKYQIEDLSKLEKFENDYFEFTGINSFDIDGIRFLDLSQEEVLILDKYLS